MGRGARARSPLMACPNDDTLTALIADALTAAERAAIAEHAATCARCHALVSAVYAERTAVAGEDVDDLGDGDPLPAGTRLGRYEVTARLGAGGMGVIYGAIDTELRRRVAIKLLRRDVDGRLGSQGRARLLREARALAALSHPNVVTMFDLGEHGDDLFLAMELVEGGSFPRWLAAAPRDPDEIVDRLIEVGRGLAAAHAAGIVHRDVKPDNVLVGRDGRARVTDFGLAGALAESPSEVPSGDPVPAAALTRTGALLGTPAYMAPEQQTGGLVDARTDQWAYCALIYEALAGVRPFPGEQIADRLAAIAAGRLAPPARGRALPRWVRPIVARGLLADPAARWPDVESVVAALSRGRRRRARMRWGAALAAAAVTLAILAVWWLGRDRGRPPPYRYPDQRGGACDCPFSACDGRCLSTCRARAYQYTSLVAGLGGNHQQDIVLGASADGATLLYLTGRRCAVDRLMIAHAHGARYVATDLTNQVDPTRVRIGEGCCTLTRDGAAVIAVTPDRRGFVRMALAGDRLGPPEGGEFAALARDQPDTRYLALPVMSADQRTLYLQLTTAHDGDEGPKMYVAARADARAPFSPAHPLEGLAQKYDYVTGITDDDLTLFVTDEYSTRVLVRATTAEPFGVGAPGWLPPEIPAYRTLPVDGCARLLATFSPGGCAGEELGWLDGVE